MRERAEWRTALTALLAMSGVGLSSGRALSLFFGQLQTAAWPGILLASALFGALIAGAARIRFTNAGGRLESACEILRLLLASLISAMMLYRLGRMGEMTLPLRHSYAFGAAFGLLLALTLCRVRSKWLMGLVIVLYTAGFFIACAADTRPVRVDIRGAVEYALGGSLPAAVLLGTVYAALTACVAAWGLSDQRTENLRPWRVGLLSGTTLGALLCLANLALLRGGDMVIAHPEPWVVLSARWGLAGFWLCAGLQILCAIGTLSAALSVLIDRLTSNRRNRARAIYMLAGGLIVFGILSFGR